MTMGLGAWAMPSLALAWSALGIGVAAIAAAVLRARAPRWIVVISALAAALASPVYVQSVLGGAPRIIDATTYWLQSKLFAQGALGLHATGPASSVRGRFLLEIEPGYFAGIFPPGYPTALAVFQRVGAPWLLGALLAFALVWVTARLAAELAPAGEAGRRAAWVAALLSLLCGALRYHTADTMSHGLCALACSTAILCVICTNVRGRFWIAGALLGVVLTTRFASALALGAWLTWSARRSWRALAQIALGALPFAVALALYQRALTGSAWLAPQTLYYLRADAPWGCFRYGFGANVGCGFEHDVMVRHELADHVYGAWQALGVSARRMRLHLLDIANLEVLVPLVVLGALRARAIAAFPLLVMLAYAPFYFDGNYPGGGARLWSDALPIEHALIAVAVAQHVRASWLTIAASAVGFALHAAPEHLKLRDRDGGRPMWKEEQWDGAPVVLTNTDHGFNLAVAARADRRVVRLRGDANDVLQVRDVSAQLVFFDVDTGFRRISPYVPVWTDWFEGEHEWPARATQQATAVPSEKGCNGGRALLMTPADVGAEVVTSMYVERAGSKRLRLRAAGSAATLELAGTRVHVSLTSDPCAVVDVGAFPLRAGDHSLRWQLDAPVIFDALQIVDE